MSKRRQTKELPPVVEGVRVYTDGSAYTETRQGGWGVYIIFPDGQELFYSSKVEDTTISRMEMAAMLKAMEVLERKGVENANIYSDSAMVVNSINKGWLKNWAREKFVGRLNSDIWMPINDVLNRGLRVGVHHINGHLKDTSHPHIFGNSVADLLADYKT